MLKFNLNILKTSLYIEIFYVVVKSFKFLQIIGLKYPLNYNKMTKIIHFCLCFKFRYDLNLNIVYIKKCANLFC